MANNQDTSPQMLDHSSDAAAVAPIWVLLLALTIVVEIAALPGTRSILVAVLP
jgi:hypothetical protein